MSDYDSKIIRKQIRVYGSVQGVGFRYRTEHAAESVGARCLCPFELRV